MPRQSLVEYLEEAARFSRDAAFVSRQGYRTRRVGFTGLRRAAAGFARLLEEKKIGRGERVLLWGENSAEWVAAFWGCLLRGVVVVPMDSGASLEFVANVIAQTGPRLLVHDRLVPAERLHPDCFPVEALTDLAEQEVHPAPAPVSLTRADTAEIIFTSGTTAEPRGVVLSHGNLLANLDPLEHEIEKYRKYERWFHPLSILHLLPLSHVFGQFMGIFVPVVLGATVVFPGTLNPSELIRAARRERVWVLAAVPRMLEALREKLLRDAESGGRMDRFLQVMEISIKASFLRRWWRFRRFHRLFGWRFCALVSGGAALDEETESFWRTLGFVVIQGYGLTETASLVSLTDPFLPGSRSIGRSLAGREVKLDATGEILVRGESVATAYWRDRQLQPLSGEQGWFHTGDFGEMDEAGNLYFKGRKKNVLVTPAGMNIYPEDLEAALRRQPEVKDCVVVAIPRNGNEEPCAVLLLRPGEADPKQVVARANGLLADYQRMRHWQLWPAEDFPRTPTQKPRINLIREAVRARLAGAAAGPEATTTSAAVSPLEEMIQRISGSASGTITGEMDLEKDLNLSSLDRVELLSEIEDRYQVDLGDTQYGDITRVADIQKLLKAPVSQTPAFPYARWAQSWPVELIRVVSYYLLVWPATHLMAWPRIRDRHHLRGWRGPFLIVSNHVTEIDPGFILAALPIRLRHRLAIAMVGERLRDLRHPPSNRGEVRGWIDRTGYLLLSALFNVFPLPKQSSVRSSFRFAGELADRGYSVLIFPEGQLTRDGGIGPFQSGIGVLVRDLDLPVVPVHIDGLFELRRRGKRWARPGAVRVRIGSPIEFEKGLDPEAISEQLRSAVCQLRASAG